MNNSAFSQANSVGLNGSFIYPSISAAYLAIPPAFATPQLIELSAAYDNSTTTFPITLNPIVGATSTVTIRPAAGNNGEVITSSTTNNYLFLLQGCIGVIIDGRPGGVESSPANYLTVSNTFNTAANGNAGTVQFNGADNCIYQFINANAALGTLTFTGARVINIAGVTANTSDNNIVQNCFVTGGLRGIQDFGLNVTTINQNNIIRNNNISQFFNLGILSSNNNNNLFKQNKIHFTSVMTTVATFLSGMQFASNKTVVEENEVVGLTSSNCTSFLGGSNFGSKNVFRNNKIHDFVPVAAGVTQLGGFQFSGIDSTLFTENEIYNLAATTAGSFVIGLNFASNGTAIDVINCVKNKIYNLSSTSTSNIRGISAFPKLGNTLNIIENNISLVSPNNNASAVFGILLGTTAATPYNANVLSNSVRIGGSKVANSGTGLISSYGLDRTENNLASNYRQKFNNIINERTTTGDSTQSQVGSWINALATTMDVDFNNYYTAEPNPAFNLNAIWVLSAFGNTAADLTAYKARALLDGPYEQNTTFTNVYFLKLIMNFQACPDKSPVRVELRSSTSPYNLIDSSTGAAGGAYGNVVNFDNITNGTPYYLVVKSVNMVETWSASTVTFDQNGASYDFTSAISQAYGNNQVLSGGIPSVFQGDANQDGFVDGSDVILTYNNSTSFITTPATDFNCDGTTDLSDIILAFNNATNFVQAQRPPLFDEAISNQNVINDNTSVINNIKSVKAVDMTSKVNSEAMMNASVDR